MYPEHPTSIPPFLTTWLLLGAFIRAHRCRYCLCVLGLPPILQSVHRTVILLDRSLYRFAMQPDLIVRRTTTFCYLLPCQLSRQSRSHSPGEFVRDSQPSGHPLFVFRFVHVNRGNIFEMVCLRAQQLFVGESLLDAVWYGRHNH